MRVGRHIAIALGLCGSLGLALGASLASAHRTIEARVRAQGQSSQAQIDARQLELELQQWLILSDLILGSGETYLCDGAGELSESLRGIIDRLEDTTPSEAVGILRAFVDENEARIERAYALSGDDREARLSELLIELDETSIGALAAFDGLHADLQASASRELARLDSYRERLLLGSWGAGLFYMLIVGIAYRTIIRQVERPLRSLAEQANVALEEGRSLTLEARGAEEICHLTRSLQEFAGHLEEQVARRTSELEEANESLEVARDAAELAARTKSEFLANMSHEIRTPMNAIIGFAEIHDDLDEAGKQDAVRTIHRNGEHLLGVINDILDFSKIEAGRMTVDRVPVNPAILIQEVISLLEVRTHERPIEFEATFDSSLPPSVTTDPTRLRQILLNLAGNAIKFTSEGRVRLLARHTDDRLVIEVSDTGIGMAPQEVARLFRPFEQADASMTRRFGGTGLGLVISGRLAELLGGSIDVASAPGSGSTFTVNVTAPVCTTRQSVGGSPVQDSLKVPGANILVAEDFVDNQRLIDLLLRKLGHQCTIVENGQLAFDAVRQAEACGEPFDLVFMDMQMPVMDGYEATRQLRESGHMGPIIALTAHAMSKHRDECIEAGCNDFVSKPIDRTRLATVLAAYLRRQVTTK